MTERREVFTRPRPEEDAREFGLRVLAMVKKAADDSDESETPAQ